MFHFRLMSIVRKNQPEGWPESFSVPTAPLYPQFFQLLLRLLRSTSLLAWRSRATVGGLWRG